MDALYDEALHVGPDEISDGIIFVLEMIDECMEGLRSPKERMLDNGTRLVITDGTWIAS